MGGVQWTWGAGSHPIVALHVPSCGKDPRPVTQEVTADTRPDETAVKGVHHLGLSRVATVMKFVDGNCGHGNSVKGVHHLFRHGKRTVIMVIANSH